MRSASQGIRAARFVRKALEERGHSVELVDPAEVGLPLLAKMYKEYDAGKAPEGMEKLASRSRSADAFVFVAGECNHGIPAALTNLLRLRAAGAGPGRLEVRTATVITRRNLS